MGGSRSEREGKCCMLVLTLHFVYSGLTKQSSEHRAIEAQQSPAPFVARPIHCIFLSLFFEIRLWIDRLGQSKLHLICDWNNSDEANISQKIYFLLQNALKCYQITVCLLQQATLDEAHSPPNTLCISMRSTHQPRNVIVLPKWEGPKSSGGWDAG